MEVTLHDQKLALVGNPPEAGEAFPHFKVFGENNQKIKTRDLLGKATLISVIPDIDTRVCSIQTKKFNQQADHYPNVRFLTISNNSVAEQAGWCAKEDVENLEMGSDEELSFGYASKLYLPNNGTLARAIYILDADGQVTYREIVPDLSQEPDYLAALDALKPFA